jgi:hypothetical protein
MPSSSTMLDVSTAGENRDFLRGGRPRASQGSRRSARHCLGVPELGTSTMLARGTRRELEPTDGRTISIRRPSVLADPSGLIRQTGFQRFFCVIF